MKTKTIHLLNTGLLVLSLSWGATTAQASLQTFNLDYSGLDFGNNAIAYGSITIDDQVIENPTSGATWLYLGEGQAITDLTLTVSNASAGNGTFHLTDFDRISWDTAGATLNLSQQLVAQTTTGGGWGTTFDGSTGDFNFEANANSLAPTLAGFFTLATNNDVVNGNLLKLTSVQPVPLPASLWLFGSAIAGFMSWRRSRLG